MGFLRNLFGKKQSAQEQPPSGKVTELQEKANEKLGLLRHLTKSGKFDHDSMATYTSMLEQSGVEIDPQKKSQMLNAGELIMPKPQSDGRVIDGFEQLRQSFMQVHMEELSTIIKLAKALPPEPASFQLLKRIIDETGELQRRISSAPKSFDELKREFDETAGSDPQKEAKILQRMANAAESDIQKFEVATRYTGFKKRYG